MNKEELETISVPHFEGYKCIGYVVPKKNQYFLYNGELTLSHIDSFETEWLVYEKLQPKRYIFEETGEFRVPKEGEWFLYEDGVIYRSDDSWENKYKILYQIYE